MDHKSVIYQTILSRPASFTWETSGYLKVTTEGSKKFEKLLEKESWNKMELAKPDVNKMAEVFHCKLDSIVSQCFVLKRSRRCSNESPWVTEGLRKQKHKQLAIFRTEGRSKRWKAINKAIKKTVNVRKEAYFNKETDRPREIGRGGG